MKKNKAILASIENMLRIIILPIIAFCLLTDSVILIGTESYWLYIYGTMVLFCLVSLFLTFFPKVKKFAYVVFAIAILSWYIMDNNVIEIIKAHKRMDCLELGQLWDPTSGKCIPIK